LDGQGLGEFFHNPAPHERNSNKTKPKKNNPSEEQGS
jgi:hypothetical protein